MSIIIGFETRYICRLLPDGSTILNAYTPVEFSRYDLLPV